MKIVYTNLNGPGPLSKFTVEQNILPRREDIIYLPGFISGAVTSVRWYYTNADGFRLEEPYVEVRIE